MTDGSRDLTEAETATYRAEGVVHAPACVSDDWVERMLAAVDRRLARPGSWVQDTNAGAGEGRFFHDRYLWPTEPEFRAFVFESGVAKLAGQAMGSDSTRIYFDHVFVKEPNTDEPFMWHQDLPYWPFSGTQICSVWLALTASDLASSALEFVRGSNRWDKWFRPVIPGGADDALGEWIGKSYEDEMPDFGAMRDDYEFLSFAVEPGDALIFDTRIVHASHGNASADRRRVALSTRWLGDDAVWDPRPGTDPIVTQDMTTNRPGEGVSDDDAFPVVWTRTARAA